MNRATQEELGELVAGDPHFWPEVCASVAERGVVGLREAQALRGWTWQGLWGWIQADEGRKADYAAALEAYAQGLALETVGLADGADPETVAKAKLQVETRFKLAGKLDRARWGETKREEGQAVLLVDAGLVGFAAAMLERLRPGALPAERVVEALPVPDEDFI